MLGGAVGFDSLGKHRHDVFGGDAAGDDTGGAQIRLREGDQDRAVVVAAGEVDVAD